MIILKNKDFETVFKKNNKKGSNSSDAGAVKPTKTNVSKPSFTQTRNRGSGGK